MNRAMAMLSIENGYDSLIINPQDRDLVNMIEAARLIHSGGESIDRYMAKCKFKNENEYFFDNPLAKAIFEGNTSASLEIAKTSSKEAYQILEQHILPVFELLSKLYDNGEIYLPQLMASSRSATQVIGLINETSPEKSTGPTVLMATVEGDYHDIGKSIAALILRANGYEVVDLGKGVRAMDIIKAIKEFDAVLLGLSCLMSTSLGALTKTAALVKKHCPSTYIMAGGAVLTQEYCTKAKIDFYCPQAMDGLKAARKLFKI